MLNWSMAWAPPHDECRCEGLRVLGDILQQWASLYQRQGDVFDDLPVRRACGDCYGGCEQEPPRRPQPRHSCNSLDVAVGSRPSQGITQVSQGGVGGLDSCICCFQCVILQHVQLSQETVSIFGLGDVHQKHGERPPTNGAASTGVGGGRGGVLGRC